MERLTERDEFGNADIIGVSSGDFQLRLDFDEFNRVTDALNRLAAYEDTGLEPEDTKKAFNEEAVLKLAAQALGTTPERLRELVKAQDEGRVVVLDKPRKPLVWGDDNHNSCLCPDCSENLMGIPYGEYMILQCPVCGQYLDATKIITRAEAAKGGGGDG